MKKISAILAFGILAAALFTGCQDTPEKPVVIQKDLEQMIEAVKSNDDKKTLPEMVNAPDKMQLTVQDGSGSVTVNADAKVLVPEAEGISTLRIRKRNVSQAEADKILQNFIGDNAFYNSYEGKDDVYVDMLLQLKAEIVSETDPHKRAQLQAKIDKFEAAGIKATEGSEEMVLASKVFEERTEGGQAIQGYSQSQEGNRFLQIVNNPETNEYRVLYTIEKNGFASNYGTYYDEANMGYMNKIGLDPEKISRLQLSISKEHAQDIASESLRLLGLDYMTLVCCNEVWGGTYIGNSVLQDRHAYRLEYMRQVDGVPITYSRYGIESCSSIETSDGGYAAQWPYERVHFIIDDMGIAEFIWESPYELAETVTEHSALMSFEEIQNVFAKMMPITNAYTGGEDITIEVTRVQLGLMRITEKDSTDTALLIPVWDFFGTYMDNGIEKPSSNQEANTSLITINAIDGSIIDRSLGY